jgi:hypothetical protein
MSHQVGLSRLLHERPSGPHVPGHGSGFNRSRAERVQPLWPRPEPALAPAVTVPTTVRPEDIRFRRLRTQEEIACVLPLRREINLHVADPAGFAILEKKEMHAALSADSNGADISSAPSASFPSGGALRLARTSSPARA